MLTPTQHARALQLLPRRVVMAYVVMPYRAMAYVVMACVVMAYVVAAYVVVACVVMAPCLAVGAALDGHGEVGKRADRSGVGVIRLEATERWYSKTKMLPRNMATKQCGH